VLLVDRQKIIKVAEGKFNNSNGQVKIPTTWTGMSALTTVPSDARPGYRERRTDEISFVKADQGWMVDDSE
jgi:hypothetical protein